MDKKKAQKIAVFILVAGLVIYAGILHKKLNSYHQFVEGSEFTTASIMLDENYVFYTLNPIIEESMEKEEISKGNFSNLQSTYRNVRAHLETLSNMAWELEGQEVNRNHLFKQLSEIIHTLERMNSENNGSVELNDEQIDFFQDVLTLNDEMYNVFETYESVPNKERKNFDRDYWVDYMKDIGRETKGIVVSGVNN